MEDTRLSNAVSTPEVARPRWRSRPSGAFVSVWDRICLSLAHRDWSLIGAASLSLALALAALYWSYQSHLILSYIDSVSHLNIARRVFDSRTPGLVQLGTVWLPLPHVLMQPFIYNDFLWRTGLAGSIVGLLCFVGTALSLFLSIRLLTRREIAAWIGLAVFVTNPNALYLQTTALTEPVLLLTMTASGYFLIKWGRTFSTMQLTAAGLLAAAAVVSRYDGWFFAVASGALVTLIAARRSNHPSTPRIGPSGNLYLRSGRFTSSEGPSLLFFLLPGYAILLWLFYNWTIFGDPLAFQRSEYSADFQQKIIAAAGSLPTKHNLILSVATYTWAVIDNVGIVVLILALAGLLLYTLTKRLRASSLPPYVFLASYPFNILSLWLGQTIIVTLHSAQPGYFNIRYGLPLLPGMALFVAYLVDRLLTRKHASIVVPGTVLLLMIQAMLWIPGWPTSVVAVADGMKGQSANVWPTSAAEFLSHHYAGGGVLIDDSYAQLILLAGLDMREYITVTNGPLWERALRDPSSSVEWIVISPQKAQLSKVTNQIDLGYLAHYSLRFEDWDSDIALYQRDPDRVAAIDAQAGTTDGPPDYSEDFPVSIAAVDDRSVSVPAVQEPSPRIERSIPATATQLRGSTPRPTQRAGSATNYR